jgi:branched-chain amino acid transport system substrate-binding protein
VFVVLKIGKISPRTRTVILSAILLTGSAYLVSLQIWSTLPVEPTVIRIGVISSSTPSLTSVKTLMVLAEEDINSYYKSKGQDTTFRFEISDAAGSSETHLDRVKEFKAEGINIVIGGAWSSQASASLSYVNENNMLLLSPGSTSPALAIPDDNLFRLCPDDAVQGRVISEVLWSWGIKAIVVIQRGDVWADGIYDALSKNFSRMGGAIVERARYDPIDTDFGECLKLAEEGAQEVINLYGVDHVAVEVLGFHEVADLATMAKDYPTIYGLYWFGSDGTALNIALSFNTPEEADHLKIFSPLAAPVESQGIEALRDRYLSSSGKTLDTYQAEFYAASWYDTAWICAKAVLEAGTTDTGKVKEVLPRVADDNYATGLCRLNLAGDRKTADYIIWGYSIVDGRCEDTRYGLYDGLKGEITWDTETLGFSPPGQS